MIQLNTNKQLNIILKNTNRALEEVLKDISPKELATLSKGKDLKSILNGIFKQSIQNSSQDKLLLDLIKSNSTFKELGSFANNIKDLLQTIKQDKNPLPVEKFLENFLDSIKNINEENIQNKIKNSGIFLESKIKNLQKEELKEMFSQDLKSVLLKTNEEISSSSHPNKQELLKQLDKLSLQIDYYQLLSHLSNSSSLYVPYSWDAMEDGHLTIKNIKNEKFFTDIDLKLKEYGELKLRLGIFETNQLNIDITTESQELKIIIQENIQTLKTQLIEVGIKPLNIRFLEMKNTNTSPYNLDNNININFEVKV